MSSRQQIAEEQWTILARLFPASKGRGRPPMDMRMTVEAIVWRFRTGALREVELDLSAVL